MIDFKHIWSDLYEMAADVSKPYPTVGSWMQRGIPKKHFPELITAASLRGIVLSRRDLESFNNELRAKRERAA
jgi:hypothetical protein